MDAMKQPPVNALGYLAANWTGINEATPAVIANPQARPLDLLAWCWGEVMSLEASAQAMTTVEVMRPGELSAIYLHRLTPLANVLEAAVTALAAQAQNERRG